MQLNNSKILITGASSGIGEATAKLLAARGADVALLARTASALENVARAITANGGSASVFPIDAADWRAVETLAPTLTTEFGTPDVIINSAGVGRWLFTEETEPEEALAMMNAPYFAAFFITRAFLPAMLSRRSGVIVNINSPIARLIWPGAAGYAAARGAMHTFTRALRVDLHGTGLRVLEVMTAKVDTPYFTHNPGTLDRVPKISVLVPTVSAEQVAQRLVSGLERGQSKIIMPFMLRAFLALNVVFPQLTELLAVRTGHQHKP